MSFQAKVNHLVWHRGPVLLCEEKLVSIPLDIVVLVLVTRFSLSVKVLQAEHIHPPLLSCVPDKERT